MTSILLLTLVLSGLYFFHLYLNNVILNKPPTSYPNSKNISQINLVKKTLVCFGDSNTHGNVSFDWVKELPKSMNVFNAGINADLTFTLLGRIDDVIKCKPDFVSILIGTNDVNALMSKSNLSRYIKRGKISTREVPNEDSFKNNYEKIIQILLKETNAKIALISLPLLSEDFHFDGNIICDRYSEIIKLLSVKYKLTFLDFRNNQKKLIPNNRGDIKWGYSNFRLMLNTSVLLHYLFGAKWNFISLVFKNHVTTDNIHLNERSGQLLINLISDWINEK